MIPDINAAQEALSKLPPRQRNFTIGIAEGKNQRQAAIDAGYPESSAAVRGSQLVRNDNVIAAFDALGLSPRRLAERMASYMDDTDPKVRPSSVRAGEILMRARGMLNTDVNVNIDARSVVLDGADSLSVADLEQLAQSLGDDTEDDT